MLVFSANAKFFFVSPRLLFVGILEVRFLIFVKKIKAQFRLIGWMLFLFLFENKLYFY